ncbi:MAG: 6-phosphogluconolactonase [Deltaproteobacteria bacterium]|nr:6-phosphogluconolactonase [Deltaproteobacteria bacterium]
MALLGRKGSGEPRVAVVLSGGETPRRTYELLASEPYRSLFPWASVHFFQVDERWVPAGDPASNRRMIRETLLSRAPVPPGNFHPVDTSLADPASGARGYEETLRATLSPGTGGFPRFDAILLGIGQDGHTASLFPGSPALDERTAWAAAVPGPDPGLSRVTLTLPVLSSAAQVIFLVSGKGKAGILKKVLSPEGDRTGWPPAARVTPSRGQVTFLADAGAASLAAPAGDEAAR